MKRQIIAIIENYGMLMNPEQDINTSEAIDIIKGSRTKMEIVGNGYLYGYMRGSRERSKKIPVYNLRQMTDEEWNKLAAQNRLEREVSA